MRALPQTYRPNMFIGTGTGRCGTKSLALILHSLPGVQCWHEHYFRTKGWNTLDVQRMVNLFQAHPSHLTGECGALWLSFVPFLRMQFPGLPVICLHRDKQAVVGSFTQRIIRADKAWILNPLGRVDKVTPEFIAMHWDWAEGQMERMAEPVFHMDMEELNDTARLHSLCDFLEIPEERRQFPEKRKHNVGLEGYDELQRQVQSGQQRSHEREIALNASA